MFCTGQITAVNATTGEVQITSMALGVTTATINSPLIFGSDTVGVQYMPKINDFVLLENVDNHHTYIIGSYTPPNNLQQNLKKVNAKLLPLVQDEIILFNSAGACVKLDSKGTIHICPGGSGTVKIHNLEVDNIKTNMQGI